MTAKHSQTGPYRDDPLANLSFAPPASTRRNRGIYSPPAELADGYSSIADVHQKALGFLKPRERALLKRHFNADGTKVTGAKATSSAQKSALKRRNDAFQWLMEKAGLDAQRTSIPTFIDKLPLTRDQKRVFSQVEFLARQKLHNCCAKNLYLAVTLDLAQGTVSNIISLLLTQGYIIEKSEFDGRSRHLILNPAKFPALEEKGQRASRGTTEVRQPMDAAPIADGSCIHSELTLPPSKMEAASILNGRGKTENRPQPRMDSELTTDVDLGEPGDNLEDNHDTSHDARAATRPGAGVLVKSSVSCGGASPQTPPGGKPPGPPAFPQSASRPEQPRTSSRLVNESSRSIPTPLHNASAMTGKVPSGTKAPSAHAVPNDNGDAGGADGSSQEAKILVSFFSSILPHFPAATGKVNNQVEELARKFFQENPKVIALEVANYFLRTLHLANQQITYPSGKVFQFGASKSSRRDLAYFFNNLEKVQSEVHDNDVAVNGYAEKAANFWNRNLAWLLARLFELIPEDARTDIEEVFAHEMAIAEEDEKAAAVEKETQRQAQEQKAKEEELIRNAAFQREVEEHRASLDGEVAKMPPAKAIQIIERWRRQLDDNLNGRYSREAAVAFEVLRRGGNEFPFLKGCNTDATGLRRRLRPLSKQTEAAYSEELGRFKALAGERPSKKDLLFSGEAGDAQQS